METVKWFLKLLSPEKSDKEICPWYRVVGSDAKLGARKIGENGDRLSFIASRVWLRPYNYRLLFNRPLRPMIDPMLLAVPTSHETQRLILRSFRVEDAPALHAALAESIVELRSNLWFLPWVAQEPTLESAQIRCAKAAASFLLRTDLPYLAFEKSSQKLVASIGLHRTDWTLPKTEVGYWVRTKEVDKGYASEGVMALTNWALTGLGAQRVELVTDEKNQGSRAVALRCGFSLEGVLRNVMQSPDGKLRNSCVYAKLPTT
jgi:RimJ/RimL family protein N-acetyltransferase